MSTQVTFVDQINQEAQTVEEIENNVQVCAIEMRAALSVEAYDEAEKMHKYWNEKLSKKLRSEVIKIEAVKTKEQKLLDIVGDYFLSKRQAEEVSHVMNLEDGSMFFDVHYRNEGDFTYVPSGIYYEVYSVVLTPRSLKIQVKVEAKRIDRIIEKGEIL